MEIFILIIALIIFFAIVKLAIRLFKYSFDDGHGWILRIIAFLFACAIVSAIING